MEAQLGSPGRRSGPLPHANVKDSSVAAAAAPRYYDAVLALRCTGRRSSYPSPREPTFGSTAGQEGSPKPQGRRHAVGRRGECRTPSRARRRHPSGCAAGSSLDAEGRGWGRRLQSGSAEPAACRALVPARLGPGIPTGSDESGSHARQQFPQGTVEGVHRALQGQCSAWGREGPSLRGICLRGRPRRSEEPEAGHPHL